MEAPPDWRHIANGWEIPTENYSDQPYIIPTDDGAWLCVVTTGAGYEGQTGQHVVTLRSTNQGRTWSAPADVEPTSGPEASYAVLLKVPGGRIYCFYNHNSDNVREVIADRGEAYPEGVCRRVDSLGHFVFKHSDDHGRSWSAQRYDIPIRTMDIDRCNPYVGRLQFFWNVGKPFILQGIAYVSVHKVGGFGEGFFTRSEGVLLKSANLLTARDPRQITWETLPDGEFGLRTPPDGGPIAEEQSYVVLSDGSFYSVYRTIDGHPACAYSRDRGHTWSEPQYLRYADANGRRGRLVKHPRAANFVWQCANGKYLYWFHNHGGRFIREHPRRRTTAYEDRNPVWLCGGVEVDTPQGRQVHWSQPEILLYDDDPYIRMSYPDMLEENGRFFFTETQKDIARVHAVPADLLAGLWGQLEGQAQISREGLLAEWQGTAGHGQVAQAMLPPLPRFLSRSATRFDHGAQDHRAGLALDLWLRFDALEAGQVILDNRTPEGRGFCLQTTERRTVEIVLHDGRTENRWECDPGSLHPGELHHIVVTVDGGPKVITFIVDGQLHDGGEYRQFGWGRFSPHLREVNGASTLHIGSSLRGVVMGVRVYGRALRTSEAIAHHRAGRVSICPVV